MSRPERPWTPGPKDLPWITHLISPTGERHLGFNHQEGRFYRLWQHREPEPLHTGEAVLLRPSDIDLIIKVAMIWVMAHPAAPRSKEISDEVAAGAKAVVLHFAGASQRSTPGGPRTGADERSLSQREIVPPHWA